MVGALGFNIGNNIEMKVKSKKILRSKEDKNFRIFKSSGNYNFAAKDHPFSILTINGSLHSLIIN